MTGYKAAKFAIRTKPVRSLTPKTTAISSRPLHLLRLKPRRHKNSYTHGFSILIPLHLFTRRPPLNCLRPIASLSSLPPPFFSLKRVPGVQRVGAKSYTWHTWQAIRLLRFSFYAIDLKFGFPPSFPFAFYFYPSPSSHTITLYSIDLFRGDERVFSFLFSQSIKKFRGAFLIIVVHHTGGDRTGFVTCWSFACVSSNIPP
jgi:hypothetical protein